VKEFLVKHSERAILIGVGLAFLLFVGGGIYLQDKKQKVHEPLAKVSPKKVELKVPAKTDGANQKQSQSQTTSFFLKPSPDELLEQLASMEGLNENVSNAKLTGLRVIWPVYFFELQEQQGQHSPLLLDVSEDGFGVMIKTEVDMTQHPQLATLKSGQKLWIAGEIIAIYPGGTGTIYVQAEQFDFSSSIVIPSQETDSDNLQQLSGEEEVRE